MTRTTHLDFLWQDQAVEFIKLNNKQPSLILNMGTTGSGKTRMNAKALGALNSNQLRFTSVFNLKSLTLQTGEAYKNQLYLKNNEISVLIGDKNYLDIQNLDNNIEELKLDNDNSATEEEYIMEGNFNSSTDWENQPSFIRNKQKNGYNIADFIGVPTLVSTIDFCINAGDLSKGSNHNNAFLRIMTSDLIIDEIDSYEPDMLESVLRLITMSAMNKRNIVISSATLSKNYIIMIKKAFEHGLELGNMLYGFKNEGQVICISNLIESRNIQSKEDIDNYITALCLEFSKNKQKLATILPLDLSVSKENSNKIPPIFSAIKKLHINHHQTLNNKNFSFGLIRVGKIKHAIRFAKKYLTTNFNEKKYFINNELVEIKFLTYHSNLVNSKRYLVEQFLDNTLNQNSGCIKDDFVLNMVNNSKAKHVIFIIIATPVEEIGRDHDFHWSIIEPSSIQSIIQTAGRVNRHRKISVSTPNIYILQHNLSYYENNYNSIYFTKPGLEREDNKYKQDINHLLPWDINKNLYITSELRYKSEFATYDDQSIYLSLSNLNYHFADQQNNYWFKKEYYILTKLRKKDSDTYIYIIDNNSYKFYQQIEKQVGNPKNIEDDNNIYNNALILSDNKFKEKIYNYPHLEQWSNQCNISIYNDTQKQKIQYNIHLGFYF